MKEFSIGVGEGCSREIDLGFMDERPDIISEEYEGL